MTVNLRDFISLKEVEEQGLGNAYIAYIYKDGEFYFYSKNRSFLERDFFVVQNKNLGDWVDDNTLINELLKNNCMNTISTELDIRREPKQIVVVDNFNRIRYEIATSEENEKDLLVRVNLPTSNSEAMATAAQGKSDFGFLIAEFDKLQEISKRNQPKFFRFCKATLRDKKSIIQNIYVAKSDPFFHVRNKENFTSISHAQEKLKIEIEACLKDIEGKSENLYHALFKQLEYQLLEEFLNEQENFKK